MRVEWHLNLQEFHFLLGVSWRALWYCAADVRLYGLQQWGKRREPCALHTYSPLQARVQRSSDRRSSLNLPADTKNSPLSFLLICSRALVTFLSGLVRRQSPPNTLRPASPVSSRFFSFDSDIAYSEWRTTCLLSNHMGRILRSQSHAG